MSAFSRIGILLFSVLLVTACGSEDVAKAPPLSSSHAIQVDNGTSNPGDVTTPEIPPQDGEPVPGNDDDQTGNEPIPPDPVVDPDEPVIPPFVADIDTNIFFPIISTMALYYDENPVPVVLGESEIINGETVYPLEQGDALKEDFTSTASAVGIMGINVKLSRDAANFLDMRFANSQPIVGDEAPYHNVIDTNLVMNTPSWQAGTTFPVKLTAKLAANEWISIPGYEPQPARKIHLVAQLDVDSPLQAVRWNLLLWRYPLLRPLANPVPIDLWFVPGIGLVKQQFRNEVSQVQKMEGVPVPLVFAVARNSDTALIPAQALVVEGQIFTDNSWQRGIIYRTKGKDWLDVTFSASGSWQARVIRSDLPKGVYAATVRFIKGTETRDQNVSLMIE